MARHRNQPKSCLHENLGVVRSVVTSLQRTLGHPDHLDDFARGYSSLAQLRSLPFEPVEDRPQLRGRNAQAGGRTRRSRKRSVSLGRGSTCRSPPRGSRTDEVLKVLPPDGPAQGPGPISKRPAPKNARRATTAEQQNLLAPIPERAAPKAWHELPARPGADERAAS